MRRGLVRGCTDMTMRTIVVEELLALALFTAD
jgi:hypothetical protein